MKWIKKGLIYGADHNNDWMVHSALQPTPLLLGDVIRVFVGFRDEKGVGRVGYVDVAANDPSKVLGVSRTPCLDVGLPGCFDDNGVVPCAIARVKDELYLFYAGYLVSQHVRMQAFSGLAISRDNGLSFQRASNVPVMERTHNEFLFRAIHTALPTENGWLIYYGAGNKFIQGKKKTLPVYEIEMLEIGDLSELSREGTTILHNQGEEYRVGRPYVIRENGIYRMFFCKGTEKITYRLAYAESNDGRHWIRMDDKLNLDLSEEGWDSEMMAYPAFVRYRDKAYLFYNGNDYGHQGFGYAELVEE